MLKNKKWISLGLLPLVISLPSITAISCSSSEKKETNKYSEQEISDMISGKKALPGISQETHNKISNELIDDSETSTNTYNQSFSNAQATDSKTEEEVLNIATEKMKSITSEEFQNYLITLFNKNAIFRSTEFWLSSEPNFEETYKEDLKNLMQVKEMYDIKNLVFDKSTNQVSFTVVYSSVFSTEIYNKNNQKINSTSTYLNFEQKLSGLKIEPNVYIWDGKNYPSFKFSGLQENGKLKIDGVFEYDKDNLEKTYRTLALNRKDMPEEYVDQSVKMVVDVYERMKNQTLNVIKADDLGTNENKEMEITIENRDIDQPLSNYFFEGFQELFGGLLGVKNENYDGGPESLTLSKDIIRFYLPILFSKISEGKILVEVYSQKN